MNIRYAKEQDLNQIKDIWKYCFNDTEDFMGYYFNNKYKEENTIVLEENSIVSSLQMNKYTLNINGANYKVSYVVGVSTLPQVRGKGYMKYIMEYMFNELYNNNELISILMPIDYRLYRKYGYEHCYDQLEYSLDIESLKVSKVNGKMESINLENEKYLAKIYKNHMILNELNRYVERNEEYYKTLIKEVESEGGYIYLNKNEEYDGYIIYFISEGNIFVREIMYNNISSLKNMLRFIYNHNTQCKKVTISSPINDYIRMIVDNPKDIEVKIKPFMMGRIINLEKYIKTLKIDNIEDEKIEINIKIIDNQIKHNNKVFKVTLFKDSIDMFEVEEKEDIEMTINDISQITFSYLDINDVLRIKDIKINSNKDKVMRMFEILFSKQNNYINEYV